MSLPSRLPAILQAVMQGQPQALADDDGERRFQLLLDADPLSVEDRVERELRFDSDLWLVEIENRAGDPRLDVVDS